MLAIVTHCITRHERAGNLRSNIYTIEKAPKIQQVGERQELEVTDK